MTHSFKVANLAREIAENLLSRAPNDRAALLDPILQLGGLDVSACEAAGLAHDIGHPPFGHVAEDLLDEWLRGEGPDGKRCENGFEGNAQSFHTVTLLDPKSPKEDSDAERADRGMGLTAVTLAAVLKYPWRRAFGTPKFEGKFGAYHTDADILFESRQWFEFETPGGSSKPGTEYTQTLEANIMDLADDITYAAHDLTDFALTGLLPISAIKIDIQTTLDAVEFDHTDPVVFRLKDARGEVPLGARPFVDHLKELQRYYKGILNVEKYLTELKVASGLMDDLQLDEFDAVESSARIRKNMSEVIGGLLQGITKIDFESAWDYAPRLNLDSKQWHLMQVMKVITKTYVISTPRVGIHQAAQIATMEILLDKLEKWCRRSVKSRDASFLPARLQAFLRINRAQEASRSQRTAFLDFHEQPLYRSIVDFVCSLTDNEAHQLAQILQGNELPRLIL